MISYKRMYDDYTTLAKSGNFSSIDSFYNYYGGRVSKSDIKDFLASIERYAVFKPYKRKKNNWNPIFVRR